MSAVAVRALVGLLLLEAAALTLAGLGYAVVSLVGAPENRLAALLAAGFAVAVGGVLAVLGRAVSRGRAWARSPAVLINLLVIPVSIGLLQSGVWLVGTPLLLVAVGALALFTTAPVRSALSERE